MDLIANLRSFLHLKPKELIVPGNIAATIANCGGSVAQAEQFPGVTDYLARELMRIFPEQLGEGKADCMVAVSCPESAVLASHLAYLAGTRYAAIHVANGIARMGAHQLIPKEKIVLVVDECANFIRLNEAMAALAPFKPQIAAVACVVNATGRSEFSFLQRVSILALHNGPLSAAK